MKWNNTYKVQEGTGGLIWINSTSHSQVIHRAVLLYRDTRKQKAKPSKCFSSAKKADWVGRLLNRAVSQDNHTSLLRRSVSIRKEKLLTSPWFYQMINTHMSWAKSQHSHQMIPLEPSPCISMCNISRIALLSSQEEEINLKNNISKCLGKIALTKDMCIHLRNCKNKKNVLCADHFHFWG